ncbi:hypothetical protein [Gluconacetobacter sacchari]|uniref:Uncharacterized protein n=2 Tax=Gluconacetobacter sacchari TaxID=92759 RepID=A0A7W4IBA5_9PROT|nr:hypothetical protein [Gluconacetobacter sacchari]MBB2159711.1 hypothetical protein [Gluconacetobacter sacchari]
MSAARQRPGRHARAVMGDTRWRVLPLAARALWIDLCDVADTLPYLRAPSRARYARADEIARLVGADAGGVDGAILHLVTTGILEPYQDGFRLKAY